MDVAAWLWGATSLLALSTAFLLMEQRGKSSAFGDVVVIMGVIALFLFGCWKFRQGVDGWRAFFSALAIAHGLFTVTALFINPQDVIAPVDSVPPLLIFPLATVGLVLAWLPDSRRYFREMGQYRKVMKSLRMQARGLTPYPPQAHGPPPQAPQSEMPQGTYQGQQPYGQQPPQQGQPPYYGNPPQ